MRARTVAIAAGCVLLAVALVLGLRAAGVPLAFAVSWTTVAAAVSLALRGVLVDDPVLWPPERPPREARGSEVSRLAWAINTRSGVAGTILVRRVQNVLRRRLAHRGLDLDDPADHAAIDALLGQGIRAGLSRREVRRDDIERALDALERIPTDTEEAA
ncbi:hypothetical protein JQN58_38825 [Aneurinibacillus sp. BA2021]|uniref:hypothetical protein n=1 Tax=Microbacterium sp. PF5 TaxID=2305435 RepID=UPI0019804795|nr:hypothetical protein [Microbacterium sp. PF5]MBN6192837.1 hypothetical protein [Aneurinibacillus sp. BA2021]